VFDSKKSTPGCRCNGVKTKLCPFQTQSEREGRHFVYFIIPWDIFVRAVSMEILSVPVWVGRLRLTSERNDAGGLGVAGVVGSVLDEASFDSSLIFLIELHQEQT
jgi:hypothetical protein